MATRTWRTFKMGGELSTFAARIGHVFVGTHNNSTAVGECVLTQKILQGNSARLLNVIRTRSWGLTAPNANIKQLVLYWGNDEILATSLSTANNKAWIIETETIIMSLTLWACFAWGRWDGAEIEPVYTNVNADYRQDIIFSVNARTVTAADDIYGGLTTGIVMGLPGA